MGSPAQCSVRAARCHLLKISCLNNVLLVKTSLIEPNEHFVNIPYEIIKESCMFVCAWLDLLTVHMSSGEHWCHCDQASGSARS